MTNAEIRMSKEIEIPNDETAVGWQRGDRSARIPGISCSHASNHLSSAKSTSHNVPRCCVGTRKSRPLYGTRVAFLRWRRESKRTIMSQQDQDYEEPQASVALHLWTHSEVLKAVPYLRAVLRSLRDEWLEMRST